MKNKFIFYSLILHPVARKDQYSIITTSRNQFATGGYYCILMKNKAFMPSLPPPRYTTSVWARIDTSSSLKHERRISDKSCLVTIGTGASVTTALETSR
jgi:hypothetical protein